MSLPVSPQQSILWRNVLARGNCFSQWGSLVRCLVNKGPSLCSNWGQYPSFPALRKSFESLVETTLHLTPPSIHSCFLLYPPTGSDPKSTLSKVPATFISFFGGAKMKPDRWVLQGKLIQMQVIYRGPMVPPCSC